MKNSIARMRPELIKEWSPRNAPLTPEEVPFGSNKLYWWKGACGHEWQTSAKARSAGEQCPICSNARIIAGINDLESQYPELALEWSSKNNKKASEVGPGSHKKATWLGKCGHEWEASIRSRVKGSGCPWWTGSCGHSWKAKVFDRAVEHAGCIYCEKEFQWHLPRLLVMHYAISYRLKVRLNEEESIGIDLNAYIPELKLAFRFFHKLTQAERNTQAVVEYLCKRRGMICEHIGMELDEEELCAAIKRGFAKTHTYIKSDNGKDIEEVRQRFFEWKKDRI